METDFAHFIVTTTAGGEPMGSEGGAGVGRRRAGRAEGPGEWGGEGLEARGGARGTGRGKPRVGAT